MVFEVYKEDRRKGEITKFSINQPKAYLSLINKKGNILQSSLSIFEDSKYKNVDFKIVYKKETRKSKYAPEIKKSGEMELVCW